MIPDPVSSLHWAPNLTEKQKPGDTSDTLVLAHSHSELRERRNSAAETGDCNAGAWHGEAALRVLRARVLGPVTHMSRRDSFQGYLYKGIECKS